MRIVNIDLGVNISFEAGIEPKDLLRQISAEAAGSIGLISLRSLLDGKAEEISGYVIMSDDDLKDAEAEAETEAAEVKVEAETEAAEAEVAEAAEAEVAEAAEAEAVQVAETEAAEAEAVQAPEAEVEAAEAEAVQAPEAEVEAAEAEAEVAEAPEVSAKEAVQKAFGINVQEPLTPKASESTGVSRPRRDMSSLIAKAKAGTHANLLAAVEAAGYTIVNVENSERWFGFNVAGGGEARNAPRFDVSPLKNGAFSVSLYVNDRATKIKERLVPEAGKVITPEQIIASMQGEMFKAAIAEGLANLTKAAE